MSSKTKMIAFSAAGLVAAAAGILAFVSTGPDVAANRAGSTGSVAPVVVADLANSKTAPDLASIEKTNTGPAGSKLVQQPVTSERAASPTPVKLTREQLIPPAPKTEAEKLQKAAEQEYNRF